MPQVLGWIYFSMIPVIVRVQQLDHSYLYQYVRFYTMRGSLFFLALIGIATFGYLFNDFCDVESDAAAGKPNRLAVFKAPTRMILVGIAFLAGGGAWVALNLQSYILQLSMQLANLLFIGQLLALITYSMKPFRVKGRAESGVIFDAFYGHLNPVLMTICVFGLSATEGLWGYSFEVLLILVCSIKGVRNILLHQVEDRKKDESAGLNTAVIKYGPWRIINFINDILFPAEVLFLVCLTLVMSVRFPPCFIPLITFAIISYLKMSGWKLGYVDRRLLEFKFTYFMNDYYEEWLPAFMLIILSVYAHQFVFLLILHLILFPKFIIKLVKDFKKIRENFKIEEDY